MCIRDRINGDGSAPSQNTSALSMLSLAESISDLNIYAFAKRTDVYKRQVPTPFASTVRVENTFGPTASPIYKFN